MNCSCSDTDPQTPNIRRCNSIATSVVVPPPPPTATAAMPRHSASFPLQNGVVVAASSPTPALDLELISLKTTSSSLAYTSLKDLIPGATAAGLNSPTGAGGSEISIRNRLVKQAAWAYLQPMSTSPSSASPRFLLRRLWLRFSSQNVVACFLGFINRAVDCLLRALGFINHR